MPPTIIRKRIFHSCKFFIILLLFVLVPILTNQKSPISNVRAHFRDAYPTEIFSLWNDTTPTIDGLIEFSKSSSSTAWSAAAVYWMYDNTQDSKGALLLQNDDDYLYIGLDMVDHQTQSPTAWGCSVYFDRDHNGAIGGLDRAIIVNGNYQEYYYCDYSSGWNSIEEDALGSPLSNGILVDVDFASSDFEDNSHRQYELKIPLSIVNCGLGEIRGVAFEAFKNFHINDDAITWPFFDSGFNPSKIRSSASTWGDLYVGEGSSIDNNIYAQYAIEKNVNMKPEAVGYNNGTFIATGDINGDGDFELIVSSNRTTVGSNNLLAIYDYEGGNFYRMWASWETSHQSKMFLVRGIATYDFDGDGKDEIYACGQNKRILRLFSWNETSRDFDQSEYAFIHTYGLMGYIVIGDTDNDGEMEIVCGDQNGELVILKYDGGFSHDSRSPYTPPPIEGEFAERIHAVEVADMDADGKNEVLITSQISEDALSTTRLQIIEWGINNYNDNFEDDLPYDSHPSTEDQFSHSIIVTDINNDLEIETIIIGKDFLKVFEQYSFTDPAPPLQISLNDGSAHPRMAGGAAVADLDDDGENELIFGYNNGTVSVVEVITSITDGALSYIVEWKGDLGSSLGKREAIVIFDADEDGEKEAIIGDNFGQILVLGKSKPPEVTITWPTPGYSSGSDYICIWWDVTEDFFSMHHYDIFVNSEFAGRAGGGQSGFIVKLLEGINNIEVVGYDITGKSDSATTSVEYTPGAPEVQITSPENNFKTKQNEITIEYIGYDPGGNIDHYEIFRNGNQIESYTTDTSYDVSLPSDGKWNITVIVVDTTAMKGRDNIFVFRDTEEPTISITSPVDGSAVKGVEVELQWSASDTLSGLDFFEVFRDGQFYTSTTEKSHVVSLELDKEYLLEVLAYDKAGNFGSDEVTITRDTLSPQVEILSPEDGFYTSSSSINLHWNATDNTGGTGVDHSEVTVDDQIKYSGSETTAVIDLDGDGSKNILVRTFDKAGNSATDYITVVVDSTAPVIQILTPVDNYTTGLPYVIVSWNATDIGTGIKEYQIWINGLARKVITDPEVTFYQATILEEQTSSITVKSYDFLDHEGEDTIHVNHNSSAPTLMITQPVEVNYYTSSTQLNVSWSVKNLDNLECYNIYINGILNQTLLDTNMTNALVEFEQPPPDTFPEYNLTICATIIGGAHYRDFRIIKIDQSLPEVSIITPENYELILYQGLYVEWSGNDLGFGVAKYYLILNEELIDTLPSDKTSQFVDFKEGDGLYNLTIEIVDRAGNLASDLVHLQVFLEPPQFQTGLPTPYITKNGIFEFNLTVTETGLGVKELEVFADEKPVISNSYEDIIHDPFWIFINVTQFEDTAGTHNLTISVLDVGNREGRAVLPIYIDKTNPSIFSAPIFDTQLLGSTPTEFELSEEEGKNNHSLIIHVVDDSGILGVNVTIEGMDFSEVYQMLLGSQTGSTYEYNLALNLDGYALGGYQLTFSIIDKAGNSYSSSYNITLVPIKGLPWIIQGNNLLYVAVGGALIIIFAIAFALSLRGPLANRGWRDAVVAAAYVMKTGTTCIYVPYAPDLMADDQLFGGAMTGIRGVLEEITGEQVQFKVQKVEFGDKNLLIYPGEYGDAILMVKKAKPILKDRLQKFSEDFETEFKEALSDQIIDLDEFTIATLMVESYFGVRKYVSAEQVFETVTMAEATQFEPVLPPTDEELLDMTRSLPSTKALLQEFEEQRMKEGEVAEKPPTLSPEMSALVAEIIKATQKAITSLIEGNFDIADGQAQTVINSLEIVLQSGEPIADFRQVIEALPKIVEEIIKGVNYGRKGEEKELLDAIESASKLFEQLL